MSRGQPEAPVRRSGAGGDRRPAGEAIATDGLRELAAGLPARIDTDEENVEQGLARLVLTLIEFLRRVLEKQAVRRMEGGSLSEEEIERLGLTLMRLERRLGELKETFGLGDEDLRIDLGPIRTEP